MYRVLAAQINEARKRSAAFFRADLHVHSHESGDFPKLGDKVGCAQTLTPTETANPIAIAEYLKAGKRSGLHLMAITDHNKCKVAEETAKASDGELVILPGMEVSLQATCFADSVVHVIVLFPPNYGSADIERIFAESGMPIYSERKADSVVRMPVDQFIKAVHSAGGMCIASHVNSNKGMRSFFRQSSAVLLKAEMRKRELKRLQKERGLSLAEEASLRNLENQKAQLEDDVQNQFLLFLAENDFDAIEVQHSGDRQFYTGTHLDELNIRPIPCIVSSDAHNLSDIGLSGSTTYIKMTKVSFDDLKKALRDPGTRIRSEEDVAKPPAARILGIQFSSGFFQGHSVAFSDNLSCLIGGRGTGKSATIEALRYVFDRPVAHLHKEKQNDIRARLDHTLADTDVRILFSDAHGEVYVLQRRYGEKRTSCYHLDGTVLPELDPATASSLDVRIYGWGEIEELARNKRDQLTLIDGFVPGAGTTKAAVRDALNLLRENTSRILLLAGEIQGLLPGVSELPAKRAALLRLSSEILDNLLRDFDRNQKAQTYLESLRSSISEIKRSFLQAYADPSVLGKRLLDAVAKAPTEMSEFAWYADFRKQAQLAIPIIRLRYSDFITDLSDFADLCDDIKHRAEADLVQIEASLNAAVEQAENADVKTLLSQRKILTEEVGALDTIQQQIDAKQKQIDDLLSERWTRILPLLQRARREVTGLRRKKIAELNNQLASLATTTRVHINLLHQKERKQFELALGSDDKDAPDGLLKHVNKLYLRDKYAKLYASRHSPHTFVRAVLDHVDKECSKLRATAKSENGESKEVITQERASDVQKHLDPRLPDSPYFDKDKFKRLLELEHCDTEDLPLIYLDDKPIEELSPGQRCSALLPIILLESSCPLIIDQPEDNLDNKMVFSLVVDIIRSLKERRQIIVASHNPNIPVSGDAEQIIVFDAPSRTRCTHVNQGSIDCNDIVDDVKAIMEGSEEAFRIRAEKYGYHPPAQPLQKA